MRINQIFTYLILLVLFQSNRGIAQTDTITTYHSLSTCTYLSSKDHPIQIARVLPEKSGTLERIQLHLGGTKGVCKMHIFGHEGGTNFPSFGKKLQDPIEIIKRQDGDTSITILLKDSLFIENDQFYIAFTDFEGAFGLKQDSSYYEHFCTSSNGGNFYPSLLLDRDTTQWVGDNCHLAMDLVVHYEQDSTTIFRDITAAVGLPIDVSNQTIAWADINSDSLPDLLLGNRLFLNKKTTFQEVTLPFPAPRNNTISAGSFIDMDNNGSWDIIFFGTKKSWLLLNDGNGQFTSKSITIPPLPSLHAFSIADIDLDKYPDIILAQLWGKYPEPMPNYLLLNNGELDFKNVTRRLYPNHIGRYNFPKGFSCLSNVDSTYLPDYNKNRRSRGTQFTDYDQDGDADLYITNYFLETDEFYENNGEGFFHPIPPPKPKDQSDTISNHGTGIAWYDYDNDGDFDLLVPQLAHPRYMSLYDHRGTTLYRNDQGEFKDITASSGIQYEETHAGACFGDINNDGLVDMLTTVYYGCRYIDVYLQQADNSFKMSTYLSGLDKISSGNDACFVDYDNDGRLDIAIGKNDKFRLFKNNLASSNNWIKLDLRANSSNHYGINTLVKVYTDNATYTQEVKAGKGQKMQSPTTLHFGIGQSNIINKVEVYFDKQSPLLLENLLPNKSYIIHE